MHTPFDTFQKVNRPFLTRTARALVGMMITLADQGP